MVEELISGCAQVVTSRGLQPDWTMRPSPPSKGKQNRCGARNNEGFRSMFKQVTAAIGLAVLLAVSPAVHANDVGLTLPAASHPMLLKPALAELAEPKVTLALAGRTSRLNGRLKSMLHTVQKHFGKPVLVVSGCRSRAHNRRIGGASKSWHLRCMAADITIKGVSKGRLLRYVARLPGRGGVGSYCRSSAVHVDVGPRRNWYWGCRGKRKNW